MHDLSSSLRDRRREQTKRDIQLATLRLARRYGFGKITTEMIAQETGVSLRTFFNYYPNKESAAAGPAPQFSAETVEAFKRGTGPLLEDLGALLEHHFRQKRPQKEVIRVITELIPRHPELLRAFDSSLAELAATLGEVLALRIGADQRPVADLMADLVIKSMALVLHDWAHDEAMSLEQAVGLLIERMGRLGQALCARNARV